MVLSAEDKEVLWWLLQRHAAAAAGGYEEGGSPDSSSGGEPSLNYDDFTQAGGVKDGLEGGSCPGPV